MIEGFKELAAGVVKSLPLLSSSLCFSLGLWGSQHTARFPNFQLQAEWLCLSLSCIGAIWLVIFASRVNFEAIREKGIKGEKRN